MKKTVVLFVMLLLSQTLWSQSTVIKNKDYFENVFKLNGTNYDQESSSSYRYYIGQDPNTVNKIRRLYTPGTIGFAGSNSTTGVYISKIEIDFTGRPNNETTGHVDLQLKINNSNNVGNYPYWDDYYNNIDNFLLLTNLRTNGKKTFLRSDLSTGILQLFENQPYAEFAIAILNNDTTENKNGVYISDFSIKIEYFLTYQLKIDIKKNDAIYFPTSEGFAVNGYGINYTSSPTIFYGMENIPITIQPAQLIFKNIPEPTPINDTLAFSNFKIFSAQNPSGTISEEINYSFLKASQTETVVLNYNPVKTLRASNEILQSSGFENLTNSHLEIRQNGVLTGYPVSGEKYKVPIDKLINVKTQFTKGPINYPAPIWAPVFDHQNWNGDLAKIQYSTEFTANSSTPAVTIQKAQIIQLSKQSMNVTLDGIVQTNFGVQIKDPWKSGEGGRNWNWEAYTRPFTPGSGEDEGYLGLFRSVEYHPLTPLNAHYRLKTTDLSSINGVDCYFTNWSGIGGYLYNPASLETPVRFDAENAVISANYKGHLRTGAPERADQKNQRRIVADGNNQIMVYESMGEIWLAVFSGGSWGYESRLSFGTGTAKNPSISNIISSSGTDKKGLITWVENNHVYCQPILLSTHPTTLAYYVILTWHDTDPGHFRESMSFASGTAREDSRPVTVLYSPDGTKLRVWFAYEKNNGGVISGNYDVPSLFGASIQSGIYSPLNSLIGKSTTVSTSTGDQYSVLVYQPAAQGFPEKRAVYYLGTGYASGKRIVEYSVTSNSKTVFPVSNSEYTFYSLSGGVNSTSASYTLVANAQRNLAGGVVSYDTEIYQKASYYSVTTIPSLSKIYSNATNPVVMVQNTSYIGSPVYEVNFKQGTSWYKATGGASITQIGSNVGGIFAREQVGASDRNSIFVKTNTTPANLVEYSGSGVLNKGEGTLYADVRSVRNYTTLSGQSKTVILDFTGALVEPVDSLENGSKICAVKLISPDRNTIIVRQPDSIKTALAIDLVRNGVSVRSYSASLWDELSINSFEDVQDGDVLVFRLGFPVVSSWGYEIYDFNGTSLSKPDEATAGAVKLKKLENGVAVYPNPFNPNTSISVSLEVPASVNVMVYNILGQLVSDFGKADLGAGVHNYAFDGKTLASGTYFYRVEIGDKVKTGKLQLLK